MLDYLWELAAPKDKEMLKQVKFGGMSTRSLGDNIEQAASWKARIAYLAGRNFQQQSDMVVCVRRYCSEKISFCFWC